MQMEIMIVGKLLYPNDDVILMFLCLNLEFGRFLNMFMSLRKSILFNLIFLLRILIFQDAQLVFQEDHIFISVHRLSFQE